MALTTAEQSYIRGKIDRLKAQKNMRKFVDVFCRLERDVDRNGWDAYLAGLYVTAGRPALLYTLLDRLLDVAGK